jgi:hypothetical protein
MNIKKQRHTNSNKRTKEPSFQKSDWLDFVIKRTVTQQNLDIEHTQYAHRNQKEYQMSRILQEKYLIIHSETS